MELLLRKFSTSPNNTDAYLRTVYGSDVQIQNCKINFSAVSKRVHTLRPFQLYHLFNIQFSVETRVYTHKLGKTFPSCYFWILTIYK